MHPQALQTELFGSSARRYTAPGREAQARKNSGQFKAASKAGSFWLELALDKLRAYLKQERKKRSSSEVGNGLEFTFEAYRVWAEANDLPPPASLNAWGALPMAAKRAGICNSTGRAEPAKRAESHGRLIRVWRTI